MPSTQFAKKMLSVYVNLGPWEEDHDRALACFAIEEAMSFGNLIFRWVSERDAIWHTRVLESKIEYNEAEREEWIEVYRNWLGASERLLLTIARLEGQGFEVAEPMSCGETAMRRGAFRRMTMLSRWMRH